MNFRCQILEKEMTLYLSANGLNFAHLPAVVESSGRNFAGLLNYYIFFRAQIKKHDGLRIRETELRRWRKRKAIEQITPVSLEKSRRE